MSSAGKICWIDRATEKTSPTYSNGEVYEVFGKLPGHAPPGGHPTVTCTRAADARSTRGRVSRLLRTGASVGKRVRAVWFVSRAGVGKHSTGTPFDPLLSSVGCPERAPPTSPARRGEIRVILGVVRITEDRARHFLQGGFRCCAYRADESLATD